MPARVFTSILGDGTREGDGYAYFDQDFNPPRLVRDGFGGRGRRLDRPRLGGGARGRRRRWLSRRRRRLPRRRLWRRRFWWLPRWRLWRPRLRGSRLPSRIWLPQPAFCIRGIGMGVGWVLLQSVLVVSEPVAVLLS